MGHSSGHGPGVGPDGVGGVEDDAAHAAHMLLLPAGPVLARAPVSWGGVRAALGLSVSPQPGTHRCC